MLALLLHLHIVLRDEYREGNDEYVRVAVHFRVPQIKFARSKRPPNTEEPTASPMP